MNRSALRNMLKVVGIIMVVMLPVMLALWFAQLRAVSEISAQLRTFAELALTKMNGLFNRLIWPGKTRKNIREKCVRRSIVNIC